jgi:hypothetical protein
MDLSITTLYREATGKQTTVKCAQRAFDRWQVPYREVNGRLVAALGSLPSLRTHVRADRKAAKDKAAAVAARARAVRTAKRGKPATPATPDPLRAFFTPPPAVPAVPQPPQRHAQSVLDEMALLWPSLVSQASDTLCHVHDLRKEVRMLTGMVQALTQALAPARNPAQAELPLDAAQH